MSTKTIRVWEAKGLVPEAERTRAGCRLFTQTDLARLAFIQQAKALGLTLSEIRDIMDLQHAGATPCGRISQLIDWRITQLDHALTELQLLCHKLIITRMIALACDRDGDRIGLIVCPIIQTGTLEC